MSKPKPPRRLDKALRWYLERSGLSLLETARRSGVHNSQLSRFSNGKRDLNLENAATLAEHLGLELVQRRA